MGISFRSLHQGSPSGVSPCVLDFPFDGYMDSPDTGRDANKHDVRFTVLPRGVGPHSRWRRVLASLIPSTTSREDDVLPLLEEDSLPRRRRARRTRSRLSRWLVRALLGFLIMLGIIQLFAIACGIVLSFFPDEYNRAARHWTHGDHADTQDDLHWPTDISRDVVPVGCHSHNDYWRPVPLYSALQAGCIGVEADVWLFDDELYVGHTTSSLTPQRTLRSMYVDPLVAILERQNPITKIQLTIARPPRGVFDADPGQSLILLIDFKTDGAATWPAVVQQLAPLRDRGYLTHFNGRDIVPGPITVVGTGNTPFDLVTANSSYRDIFFDAPLDKLVDEESHTQNPGSGHSELHFSRTKRSNGLGQGLSGMPVTITVDTFNATNSFYASVSFKKAIGFPWPFHFTQRQIDLIRAQVRVAHRHGLKVRYWSLPGWPRGLRNHIWRVLAQEGVDILNVDDLVGATKGDWKTKIFDWWI